MQESKHRAEYKSIPPWPNLGGVAGGTQGDMQRVGSIEWPVRLAISSGKSQVVRASRKWRPASWQPPDGRRDTLAGAAQVATNARRAADASRLAPECARGQAQAPEPDPEVGLPLRGGPADVPAVHKRPTTGTRARAVRAGQSCERTGGRKGYSSRAEGGVAAGSFPFLGLPRLVLQSGFVI